jgi:hypothetical protein
MDGLFCRVGKTEGNHTHAKRPDDPNGECKGETEGRTPPRSYLRRRQWYPNCPRSVAREQGPLLYTAEEVGKDPSIWNGIPLVGRHPTVNGVFVSARNPTVLANQGLGFVFNTLFDKTLRTEYWFDKELTQTFDATLKAEHQILPRIERGEPIETSTGLFTTNVKAPENASFIGMAYTHEARDFVPDHVAVLPDDVGACSIQDGCGILVNTKEKQVGILRRIAIALGVLQPTPTVNELSHEDVRDLISRELRSRFLQSDPHCWIIDIFDDYFVYEQGEFCYQLGYVKTATGIELSSDDPQPVIRQTTYAPLTGDTSMAMTANQRKEKVDFLVANCACWKDAKQQAVLNSLPDDALSQLELGAKATPTQTATPVVTDLPLSTEQMDRLAVLLAEKLKPQATQPVPVAPVVPTAVPVTNAEYLASAPPEVRAAIQNSIQIVQREKEGLVNRLIANVQEPKERETHSARLLQKPMDELTYLVSLLPPVTTFNQSPPLFIGNGGAPPVVNQSTPDEDLLVPPTLDYEQMKRERQSV